MNAAIVLPLTLALSPQEPVDPPNEPRLELLRELFRSDAVRAPRLSLRVERELEVELWGEPQVDELTPAQKLLAEPDPEEPHRLLESAGLVPADCSLVLWSTIGPAELAAAWLAAHGAAARWAETAPLPDGLPTAAAWLDEVSGLFESRSLVAVRPSLAPAIDPVIPPEPGPLFEWMAVFRTNGSDEARDRIEGWRDHVVMHSRELGVRGARETDPGVFTNVLRGGHRLDELWSPQLPGTRHLAFATVDDLVVLSNSWTMIGAMLSARDASVLQPQLSKDQSFAALASGIEGDPAAALWLGADGGGRWGHVLIEGAARWAARRGVTWDRARLDLGGSALALLFLEPDAMRLAVRASPATNR